jgi:hypothetical protein
MKFRLLKKIIPATNLKILHNFWFGLANVEGDFIGHSERWLMLSYGLCYMWYLMQGWRRYMVVWVMGR